MLRISREKSGVVILATHGHINSYLTAQSVPLSKVDSGHNSVSLAVDQRSILRCCFGTGSYSAILALPQRKHGGPPKGKNGGPPKGKYRGAPKGKYGGPLTLDSGWAHPAYITLSLRRSLPGFFTAKLGTYMSCFPLRCSLSLQFCLYVVEDLDRERTSSTKSSTNFDAQAHLQHN